MLEALFNKVTGLQVYSWELSKIFKNTFLTEHVRVTSCDSYQKKKCQILWKLGENGMI